MEMKQVATFTNSVVQEVLGETALVQEDLSNVVDIGNEIFNADAFDTYVKTLINHIGKVVFVNRPYSGSAPSVLMDGWEYGSILEKISSEMPVATENPSWELTDGKSYDPNIFNQPKASAKFFNKRTTFEIDRSITERQVKQSFSNGQQLNAFISMLQNETEKALTVRMDSLIMRTINNMIVETIKADYAEPSNLAASTGVKAVNLLYLFKQRFGVQELTADQAITNPDFIRFAAFQIGLYSDRMTRMSTLFNIGKKQRFTPYDLQHTIYLSEFIRAADVYLQADTFHDIYIKMKAGETVPYWQGSGTDYNFTSTGKISAIPSSSEASGKTPIDVSGVLAVIFDRDALGVSNLDRRVTTQYNAKAEFTNYFYKHDAGYFNDLNENFVVFFVA